MTYIEREALLAELFSKQDEDVDEMLVIAEFPAADVVPVVYCKNCKEWKEFAFKGLPAGVGACKCNLMDTDAHFYCANGVKWED